jgi:glutathione synthase/RimK-type ligase-like ATP-grasp enzyme
VKSANTPITIGSQTLLSFPKLGIQAVPAKVDTGAESSSIWASNIKEKDGKLSFVLFDANSPFYNGEKLTTKDYEVRLIKNSFGHTEFRFTAKLLVTIEGRNIIIRFTLADRSTNTYPVLIGRRTLQGRFLVDVSKDGIKKKLNVLVLASDTVQPALTKEFFKDIEKRNKKIHLSFADYNDLAFIVDGPKTSVSLLSAETDLASFDMVYFKSIRNNRDAAAAAANYLKNAGVTFADKAAIHYEQSLNKLIQCVLLNKAAVSVPKTVYIAKDKMPQYFDLLTEALGLPFVLKDNRGQKGRNIFLIKTKKDFMAACKTADEKSIDFIAQKYIPHDGHYRLLVLGKRLELTMYRIHKLSELRQKGIVREQETKLVENKEVPGSVRRMAIMASNVLSIDIAGIDMVKDKNDGKWYCLEVNDSPQLVTGSFTEEKQQAFSEYLTKQLHSKL